MEAAPSSLFLTNLINSIGEGLLLANYIFLKLDYILKKESLHSRWERHVGTSKLEAFSGSPFLILRTTGGANAIVFYCLLKSTALGFQWLGLSYEQNCRIKGWLIYYIILYLLIYRSN